MATKQPGKAVPQGSMFPVDSGLLQVDSWSCNEGCLLPTGEKEKRVFLNKTNKKAVIPKMFPLKILPIKPDIMVHTYNSSTQRGMLENQELGTSSATWRV